MSVPTVENARTSILVVEDDDTSREATRHVLHAAGFNVLCARDCREALDLVETGIDIGIALVDVMMPPGTQHGVSFARMAQRRLPELKIIFMSARIKGHDSALFYDDEILLPKPFGPRQLLDIVTSAAA